MKNKITKIIFITFVAVGICWLTLSLLENKTARANWNLFDQKGISRIIRPYPGSKILQSSEVIINGQTNKYIQCWSPDSPKQVIEYFNDKLCDNNILSEHLRKFTQSTNSKLSLREIIERHGFKKVHTKYYSLLGYIDIKNYDVGIVANYDPNTRGTVYFVNRMPREQQSNNRIKKDDVNGGDVPGVPRIPGTRRVFSLSKIQNNSYMVIYEYTGPRHNLEDKIKNTMLSNGWEYDNTSSEEFNKQLNDFSKNMLSFINENENCLITVSNDDQNSNGIITVSKTNRIVNINK